MANQEHLDILAKGVKTWNASMDHIYIPDLVNAKLQGANLNGIDFYQSDLDNIGAKLSRVDLTGASR
jgi:uncharacterized protein YjbI with pentapeptide repeats